MLLSFFCIPGLNGIVVIVRMVMAMMIFNLSGIVAVCVVMALDITGVVAVPMVIVIVRMPMVVSICVFVAGIVAVWTHFFYI